MFDISHLSIFAKILAVENIYVSIEDVETAMFNLETRSLILPNWEFSNENFTKMLVGHEVAHAIYTPYKSWKKEIEGFSKEPRERSLFQNIVNIIEDCRIDRLIQERYPGLKYNYYHSSKYLMEQDFFNLKKKGDVAGIAKLAQVDRINLWFKTRFYTPAPYDCHFNAEELKMNDRIIQAETFEEVLEISKELFEKTKEELKTQGYEKFTEDEKSKEKGEGASEGEGNKAGNGLPDRFKVDEEDLKKGQEGKDKNGVGVMAPGIGGTQGELLKNIKKGQKYPNVAVSYGWNSGGKSTKQISRHPTSSLVNKIWLPPKVDHTDLYRRESLKWRNFVNTFCSSFERKKNARNYQLTRIEKTGILNTNRLFEYQFNEDVFLSKVIENYQKNHGFVIMIDCSSSMTSKFPKVAEQLLVMTEIAKKLGVPCRAYGFSDVYKTKRRMENFSGNNISLIDLYDNRDAKKNNIRKLGALLAGEIELGGTPLADALYYMLSVLDEFKEETKVDIVNFISLTDGGDGTGHLFPYLQDTKTRAMMPMGLSARDTKDNTNALYRLIRDVVKANVIHIDITNSPTKGSSEFGQKKYSLQKEYGGANAVLFVSPFAITPKHKKLIDTFTDILK